MGTQSTWGQWSQPTPPTPEHGTTEEHTTSTASFALCYEWTIRLHSPRGRGPRGRVLGEVPTLVLKGRRFGWFPRETRLLPYVMENGEVVIMPYLPGSRQGSERQWTPAIKNGGEWKLEGENQLYYHPSDPDSLQDKATAEDLEEEGKRKKQKCDSPLQSQSPSPSSPASPELKAASALEADCHESKGDAVAFGVNAYESGSKRPRARD